MNFKSYHYVTTLTLLSIAHCDACLWDRDTLADEKKKSPKMAEILFAGAPPPQDSAPLLQRIRDLTGLPNKSDPAWWNDLAGAYLRLNQPKQAVELLEPVAAQFTNDYGIHANL